MRVVRSDYRELQIEDDFTGYIALIQMHEVTEPLIKKYGDKELCIVDKHYSWLQQLPFHEHFAVTTMFDQDGEVIQWYIDITYENGLENDMPYMDDLFLDIVVLPTGEAFQKDQDELAWALEKHIITQQQYELAYQTFHDVLARIDEGNFPYFTMSEKQRNQLVNEVI